MASSTRVRLLQSANRRFYKDGFRGVGIDQILADVGITKTAFYKHFESKDELVLEVLKEQDAFLRDTFRRMVEGRGGGDPVAQLRALFDVVEQIIESDVFQGCFFVNVAMEFPAAHHPAHVSAKRNKAAIEDFVTRIAERAGADDPRELARELCMIMDGAYVGRQITGDPTVIERARHLADQSIRSRIGPRRGTTSRD